MSVTANINVEPYTNVLVEGQSVEEVDSIVSSQAFFSLAQKIKASTAALKAAESLPGSVPAAPAAPAAPEPAPQQAPPPAWAVPQQPAAPAAPAAQPAPSGVPQCAHGDRQFRSGTSARGPWTAWFCPTPKGTPGQCAAQFQ